MVVAARTKLNLSIQLKNSESPPSDESNAAIVTSIEAFYFCSLAVEILLLQSKSERERPKKRQRKRKKEEFRTCSYSS